jgi:hypothetical protein
VTGKVLDNPARWRAFDAVVIDLRRNGGGSSNWSQHFARALWGKERVDRALAAFSGKSEVWWRASSANTRGRANGQFYPPAIEVRDLDWSTATLLQAVEADLARRQPR